MSGELITKTIESIIIPKDYRLAVMSFIATVHVCARQCPPDATQNSVQLLIIQNKTGTVPAISINNVCFVVFFFNLEFCEVLRVLLAIIFLILFIAAIIPIILISWKCFFKKYCKECYKNYCEECCKVYCKGCYKVYCEECCKVYCKGCCKVSGNYRNVLINWVCTGIA